MEAKTLAPELLHGIGGWQLLDALDIRPEVCHLDSCYTVKVAALKNTTNKGAYHDTSSSNQDTHLSREFQISLVGRELAKLKELMEAQ